MEDDLPDLSRVQQLYETGPALLGAAGDGRLAQQLLAVGGVAGASLAGAEELRRDVSVIRNAQREAPVLLGIRVCQSSKRHLLNIL